MSEKNNRNRTQTTMRDGAQHPNAPEPQHETEPTAMVPSAEIPEGIIRRATNANDMRAHFAGKKLAPKFVTLEPGDVIEGRFVRWGEVDLAEKTDRLTGTVYTPKAPTVVLSCGGLLVEFLSAHELNRSLKNCKPGTMVTIGRGGNRDIGDRRVTEYMVGFEDVPA